MDEWIITLSLLVALGWYAGVVFERVSLQRCASQVACECIRTFPTALRELAANVPKAPAPARAPAPRNE